MMGKMVDLKTQVFDSLDNAKDNGHDFSDFTSEHALLQVANDMLEYDGSLQGVEAGTLVPLIKEWQTSKK